MRYFLLICICLISVTKNLHGQDCGFIPIAIIPIDSCDFDLDNCVYVVDSDSSNTWIIGIPQKTFFGDSRSFPNAIMTDSLNPYPINNNDFIQFDIPAVDGVYSSSSAYVEFWHKFQFDTLKDGGYFKVAFDDSPYFTKDQMEYGDSLLIEYCDYIDFCGAQYMHDDLFGDSINGFTGTLDEWSYTRVLFVFQSPLRTGNMQMKSYNIEVDTVHFRFYILTDSIDGGEAGWIIDDFLYGTAYLGGNINDTQNNLHLKTYPNPVSNKMTLFMQGVNDANIDIDLFDVTGRRVKRFENIFTDAGGYATIDFTDIPPGIWMISISNENEFWNAKIIKQ